jgi:hypothetical protein
MTREAAQDGKNDAMSMTGKVVVQGGLARELRLVGFVVVIRGLA